MKAVIVLFTLLFYEITVTTYCMAVEKNNAYKIVSSDPEIMVGTFRKSGYYDLLIDHPAFLNPPTFKVYRIRGDTITEEAIYNSGDVKVLKEKSRTRYQLNLCNHNFDFDDLFYCELYMLNTDKIEVNLTIWPYKHGKSKNDKLNLAPSPTFLDTFMFLCKKSSDTVTFSPFVLYQYRFGCYDMFARYRH